MNKTILTGGDRAEIEDLYEDGAGVATIAENFDVSKPAIEAVLRETFGVDLEDDDAEDEDSDAEDDTADEDEDELDWFELLSPDDD